MENTRRNNDQMFKMDFLGVPYNVTRIVWTLITVEAMINSIFCVLRRYRLPVM